ncbi:MAG: WhiB family transcriptional regulator [Egibacteraceae bacterium]
MTHWRQKAACLDENPDLFFPIGTTGPALEQAEQAKAVCGRCEVCDQCLEWALTTNQHDGVWGGKTEDERRSLRRLQERRRVAAEHWPLLCRPNLHPSADPGIHA